MNLTVIVPTHNPRAEVLARVVGALRSQTLPSDLWELLIVDNASTLSPPPDLINWHPKGRVVREARLGLTHARLRGIQEATGDILVWVDDDNVLSANYLTEVVALFHEHPQLGAAGGKSLPDYLEPPPKWHRLGLAPLGCRDLGESRLFMRWEASEPRTYPAAAPIGAGMATRTQAIRQWANHVSTNPRRLTLGRKGSALTSGEDNDINLTLLAEGYTLAYVPEISLLHVMPPSRLTLDYQKRISRAAFRDFVRVLDMHGIRPWPAIAPWTVPLRAVRAWIRCRAWQGPIETIQWHSALGQFEGRAALSA